MQTRSFSVLLSVSLCLEKVFPDQTRNFPVLYLVSSSFSLILCILLNNNFMELDAGQLDFNYHAFCSVARFLQLHVPAFQISCSQFRFFLVAYITLQFVVISSKKSTGRISSKKLISCNEYPQSTVQKERLANLPPVMLRRTY